MRKVHDLDTPTQQDKIRIERLDLHPPNPEFVKIIYVTGTIEQMEAVDKSSPPTEEALKANPAQPYPVIIQDVFVPGEKKVLEAKAPAHIQEMVDAIEEWALGQLEEGLQVRGRE